MKRTIAIMLIVLFCISVFVACGRQNTNVSERNDGMIEEDHSQSAADNAGSRQHDTKKDTNDRTNDIKDDIGNAVDDTGDVIEDIGRDVGDAISGDDRDVSHQKNDMK